MMGSLDVTKVHWKRCPTAWKGQFQGGEKVPSIGLEAVVDIIYGSGMLHLGYLGLSMT